MEFWVGAALVNGVLAVVLLFLGDAVRALVRRGVA